MIREPDVLFLRLVLLGATVSSARRDSDGTLLMLACVCQRGGGGGGGRPGALVAASCRSAGPAPALEPALPLEATVLPHGPRGTTGACRDSASASEPGPEGLPSAAPRVRSDLADSHPRTPPGLLALAALVARVAPS
jgi:hypothetical protein